MKANEQVLIPTPPLFNRNIDHFKSEETNLCWLCSSFTFSLACRKKPVSSESCTSASTDTPGAEKYFTKGYSYLRSLTKKSCANYNLGCYKASSLKQKVSLYPVWHYHQSAGGSIGKEKKKNIANHNILQIGYKFLFVNIEVIQEGLLLKIPGEKRKPAVFSLTSKATKQELLLARFFFFFFAFLQLRNNKGTNGNFCCS